jgi:two-component system cell cycle response regulator
VSPWEADATRDEAIDPVELGARERACLIVIVGADFGEMFSLVGDELAIGRGARCEVRIRDDSVSRVHARLVTRHGRVCIEDLDSANGTYVNGARLEEIRPLTEGDKIQIGHGTIFKFAYHDSLEDAFQRQMFDSALRDGLTRVYNRRYLQERLQSELRFAQRQRAALAVLMLDLDHFKAINDTHGHGGGDQALIAVARALARSLRSEDVVARYGGEEFVVVLRGIPHPHVLAAAERLRAQIQALVIDPEGASIRVTVSIGVATYPDVDARTPEDLLAAADRCLYRAKQSGRNLVES